MARLCKWASERRAATLSFLNLRLALYVLAGLALGGAMAIAVVPSARERLLPAKVRSVGQALVGGPFTLTDHDGKRVTDQDFRGRTLIVVFGFTFCPDICPTELQLISAALEKLGPKAKQVVPLFITVDPERDTPEQLASYVKSFHPNLIGLTGTPEEIASVAKEYRVYFKKVPDPKSSAGYTMDHSALIYVMRPDGTYQAHFTPGVSVTTLADRLGELLQANHSL
jgi:cytochrome oxidase Cu insertion factor (SCO1/SenC/PrrC family)